MIKKYINEGETVAEAFATAINSFYEFADYDYFKDAVDSYTEPLKEAIKKSAESSNPQRTWNAEINWMFKHQNIHIISLTWLTINSKAGLL